MKANCFEGSVRIKADLQRIWEVLSQHEFIRQWEKGCATFKELHLCPDKNTIVHWDIENNIDYTYNITRERGLTHLLLQIDNACFACKSGQRAEDLHGYIRTVLSRIKGLSEATNVSYLPAACLPLS